MPPPDALERWTPLIAALLSGEVSPSVRETNHDEALALAQACVVHGVHGVLYHQLKCVPDQWAALPQTLRDGLEYQARADMAWELAHKAELISCLSALGDAQVDVLILKGTALAYSLYAVASIRSRGDTDLFIRPEDLPVLTRAVESRGYKRDEVSQGIGYEVNFNKTDRFGMSHVLDIHCLISSSEVFSRTLDWEEGRRMSVALTALGAHARGLHCIHALLFACVHRVAHLHSPYYVDGIAYLERNRLIWLYDVRLLSGVLQADDWSLFVDLAHGRGVSAVCQDALQAAKGLLGATIPVEVSAALSRPMRTELSAQLLLGSAWRGVWVDFRAQRSAAGRWKFVRDLFFPNRAYMLRKYPRRPIWLLPFLYVWRVLEGVQRRLRHFR